MKTGIAAITAAFALLCFNFRADATGFGLGASRDSFNRPNDAVSFNSEYGQDGAYALLPNDSPTILLTFDQGYENGYTSTILDTLGEKGVSAIFFLTGDYARTEPELVKRMLSEGHMLGNHSMRHSSFTTLSADEMRTEIMELHDYVLSEYGYEMQYFRFPCGEFNEEALKVVSECGYRSVFWSFAYVDWLTDKQPSESDGLEKLVSSAHNGAIYLLHSVSSTNSKILGEAIDRIKANGFSFG